LQEAERRQMGFVDLCWVHQGDPDRSAN
jgi:hypothetical protein